MLSSLAARNDADAWCDLASSPVALGNGATVIHLSEGSVMVTPSVDHLLFNRVFGAPVHALPDVARIYERHGVSNWMMHVAEEDLDEARRLAPRHAVEPFHRPWAKLARTAGPVDERPCDVAIEEARPGDAPSVGRLFREGFDMPPSAVPLVAALVGRPRWEVLVARDADQVVGIGLAFDGHGGTSLEGGVTARTHRGRGIQGAVMCARVRRAFARGSGWVSSETGVAVPGQPNSSWRNMERCGLRPVALWHNMVPRGARWAASEV
ncbi:MAG: hypothetical protein AAF602_14835 [Myxococcota bacterium]